MEPAIDPPCDESHYIIQNIMDEFDLDEAEAEDYLEELREDALYQAIQDCGDEE